MWAVIVLTDYNGAHLWPSAQAPNSAPTKFNRHWARAGWAKCTAHVTRDWGATSLSKFYRCPLLPTLSACGVLNRKRVLWQP